MSRVNFSERYKQLEQSFRSDRFRLKKSLQALQQKSKKKIDIQTSLMDWDKKLAASILRVVERKAKLPEVKFPPQLPVSQKIDKIRQLFEKHQVLIVAGETGSGKTTQLPKMCLTAGRGMFGKIAHTQPRRIAARSVAERIASELQSKLGELVGYKIRFKDHSQESSYIKLMTDGILLAETQGDRFLEKYDTIIIDEAHERSLNIDFLIGYIKRILPHRADLKVIITSATINTQRFADFFDNAPIIEVSGRTWPVSVRYRPLSTVSEEQNSEELEEKDINSAIADAVDELALEGEGDILVFLSGEKEIREAHKELRRHHPPHTEIIPLYSRLSNAEQNRVFKAHKGRRIILATNVAETSLTVPGISYVIDTGLAKISRYSIRSKIQRLPVEKISQASAQQRSGRCGRISAGITIRLYEEQDFVLRPSFTEPEILRTNLAQVILQMLLLGLGKIEEFPFIEAPGQKQINDGLLLLEQLGAIYSDKNGNRRLTVIGQNLARLSVDPKLGRVVLEASKNGVLAEIVIIVSALSCQDPRERPNEKQQQSDQKHAQYKSKSSDFIGFLNLWNIFAEQQKHLSQNKLRKFCKENFLSYMRMREWAEIYSQLKIQLHEMGIKIPTLKYSGDEKELNYPAIHQALLSGLMSFVAQKSEDGAYLGCRNLKLAIHPGSYLFKKGGKWIMSAEIVETQKIYARTVANIEPSWIEQSAAHLLRHHYYEPVWENKRGQVSAKDKLTLYGLTVNSGKKVNYGPIDPQISHEIFIKEALLTGVYKNFSGKTPKFIEHNKALIESIQNLEHKSRRQDILVDDLVIYEFYRRQIGLNIYSRAAFEKWCKKHLNNNPKLLHLSKEELMRHSAENISEDLYPTHLTVNDLQLPLEYHFYPGHVLDGVTVIFPITILNQLSEAPFSWLVPGFLREKVTFMLRSLPKSIRKKLVPIPDRVTLFLEQYEHADLGRPLAEELAKFVRKQCGEKVSTQEFQKLEFPLHLLMNFRILDVQDKELDSSRDLKLLQTQWGDKAEQQIEQRTSHSIERRGLTDWDFDELPEQLEIKQSGIKMLLYPALVDEQKSIDIRLFDTLDKAQNSSPQGLFRLFSIRYNDHIQQLIKQEKSINHLCLLFSSLGNCQNLKSQLQDNLIEQTFKPHQLCYTRIEFNLRLENAESKLYENLQELVKCCDSTLGAYQQIKKQLKGNVPLTLINTHRHIQEQLQQMFPKDVIARTPLNWMRRIPRYLKAIEYRLEKAIRDPRRDDILQKEMDYLWQPFLQKQSSSKFHNPQWIEYRWLLEELRLSLFAQELKTIQPVSVKRLEKIWKDKLNKKA